MPAPVLIYQPDKYFWNYDEIYIGPGSSVTQVYGVKVNDLVLIWDEGIYKVTAIDNGGPSPTMIPTLEIWDPTENTTNDNAGLITGISTYQPSVINRAFLEVNVGQDYITIDARFKSYGDATKCKLFLGTDTTAATGIIISMKIPGVATDALDMVSIDPGTPAIRRPPTIPVVNGLEDGSIVTLVTYSAAGRIMSETPFLVKETSAYAPLANAMKIIEDIRIISPWLDLMDSDLLVLPANIGLELDGATARIYYTDGSTADIAIDGVKCKLLGIDNFSSNFTNTTGHVTLTYYLDNDEFMINGGNNRQISHIYRIETSVDNLNDHYKIYLGIRYNKDTGIFGINAWLSDFNYSPMIPLEPAHFTVTDLNNNPINLSRSANLLIAAQNVVIRVHMHLVFPELYSNYTFSQIVNLDLNDISIASPTWIIDYEPSNPSNTKLSGIYKFLSSEVSGWEELDMRIGSADLNQWLERLYYPISPLENPSVPVPTHFRIVYKNGVTDYVSPDLPVSSWNTLYNDDIMWATSSTLEIIWLKEIIGNPVKLELGVTPVLIIASYL
jgi:hypothetical protein